MVQSVAFFAGAAVCAAAVTHMGEEVAAILALGRCEVVCTLPGREVVEDVTECEKGNKRQEADDQRPNAEHDEDREDRGEVVEEQEGEDNVHTSVLSSLLIYVRLAFRVE